MMRLGAVRGFGAVALAGAALSAASCRGAAPPTIAEAKSEHAREGPIGCLGRVEAGEGLIAIATRSLSGQPSIVGRLFVKEGDQVRARQILAELDSERQLAAAG